MLYRNFLAMEVEELLWSHPVDGVVLMGGCDKTTPGLVMGAASAGLPAIFVPAGPMLTGRYRGQPLGSGSDNWKYWDERRAGTISEQQWHDMEASLARSPGHCMTMGTASTMTSTAEALGLTLPGRGIHPGGRFGSSPYGLRLRPAHRRACLGGCPARRASSPGHRSSTPSPF